MKVKSESEVAQSCPTLSDPMDCSLPGSSVHGVFQARALEWGAIAFSKQLAYPDINAVTKGQEPLPHPVPTSFSSAQGPLPTWLDGRPGLPFIFLSAHSLWDWRQSRWLGSLLGPLPWNIILPDITQISHTAHGLKSQLPPLLISVTLTKWVYLSEPQFSHL